MDIEKTSVAARDVAHVVRTILEEEGVNESCNVYPYGYRSKTIQFDVGDTLLFEFRTLKSTFPNLYDADTYNLLLVLSEYGRDTFPKGFVNGISRLMRKDNIDRVVLWLSQLPDDEDFEDLKDRGVDTIAQHLPSETELVSNSLRHFVPIADATIEHSLRVSYIGNSLVTRLRKLFHLVLSEIAAPMYDDHYASSMIATKKLMEFEERVLRDLMNLLVEKDRSSVAVDVGCGTGRHSFLVAPEFSEVYAFDLSPRMIAKAQEKKKNKQDTSIVFWTSDFEYERLTEEQRFSGRTDLIIASFGMASFVEDTAGMLRRFSQWLRPGGKILLSFYNENSSVLRLQTNWRDTSLASNVDPATKSLRINLAGGVSFEIFCKPFTEGTKGEINKIFDIEQLYTYPTLQALLPNNLLKQEVASELFGKVDDALAGSATPLIPPQLRTEAEVEQLVSELDKRLARCGEIGFGHYVIVVARKPVPTRSGYRNIRNLLQRNIPAEDYEIIEHAPVLSFRDVRQELGTDIPVDSMIKTLIFRVGRGSERFVAVSVPGNARIDKNQLAKLLGIGKRSLKFASEKEVSKLGFPLGGIAPLGFDKQYPLQSLIDASVERAPHEWLYTGVGDNQKSLKIRRRRFLELVHKHQEYSQIDVPRSNAT